MATSELFQHLLAPVTDVHMRADLRKLNGIRLLLQEAKEILEGRTGLGGHGRNSQV
jgi:hypothetical protein